MIGQTLVHYKILEKIGAGVQGEVYRAKDTKLRRDVAIKVLPEDFAADEERLARFEREAKLLASLSHPNIASIHGFEESDGVKALVLELVEGRTLAERIAEGPIPVDEAIAIAKQIAEALETGHQPGRGSSIATLSRRVTSSRKSRNVRSRADRRSDNLPSSRANRSGARRYHLPLS